MVELIRQLGNYRMLRLLGRGGFADVYLGSHIYLETQAAIKVLRTRLVKEGIEPFKQEARTIARLDHPHIVRILDFGVQEGIPFLVMSYAPNGTLRQCHPRGSLVPLWQVVSYVQQVASALHYAHERHLIHRDIKPENLLIGANHEILLGDFGIARTVLGSQSLHTHELAGTIAYMAPEQLSGRSGPSSDQYSLGVLAYEWLSGQRPFEGQFAELAFKVSTMPVPPLRAKVPSLPPMVEEVIMTALQKEPRQRFPSVQALAVALEQAYDEAQAQQACSAPLASSNLPDWHAALSSSIPVEVASSPSQQVAQTENVLVPILPDLSADASVHRVDASSQFSQVVAPPARFTLSRRTLVLGLVGLTAIAGTGAGLLWLTRPSPSASTTRESVQRRTSPSPSVADTSLTSSGAMLGFDLEHTHYNPAEQKLSPDTVSRLAQYWAAPTGGSITSSPAVANGLVYVGSSDGKLYAFDTTTGKQLWTFSTGAQVNASPAVSSKAVYIGSQDSNVYAVDRTSGQQLWQVTTGDMIDSSPVVVNGIVYIGSNDYRLYAIDATTGKALWNSNIRYFIRSSPAVSNGIVYVGSPDTQLYAFNAHTGDIIWSVPTGGEITSSPAVANASVYVGSADGNLHAFNAMIGASLWSGPTGDAIYSSPAIAYGIVYVGSDDGKLYAFNTKTAKPLWPAIPLGKPIRSSPTVANGVVYVGTDDGKLYAFNAMTGTFLWSTLIGQRIQSSPFVTNGVVYVGSDDGKLYAFHLPY